MPSTPIGDGHRFSEKIMLQQRNQPAISAAKRVTRLNTGNDPP